MKDITFIKMNAAGNDFIIFDHRNTDNFSLSTTQIQKLCHRNNIGCDQLIIIKNDPENNCFMEIYNPDGSSSSACGNATRCVASILLEEDKDLNTVKIKTQSDILVCERKDNNEVSVNMGKPKFLPSEIPFSKDIDTQGFNLLGYNFYALNIGNPHIVTFLDRKIYDEVFVNLGPTLEKHELFPEKTNVEFANILSDDLIEARVYERGAGETLSCGSGACAIGTLAIKNKLIKSKSTTIRFKGGDIKIALKKDGSVIMTGGYQKIFSGKIDANFIN